MSRCFPFPPPGYEKKFSTDESDSSLLKEKQKKEKKHKKDKEKKKDKETSKDKHKERKEKKEKHKDKKKDKDRDKEKSRTTSENRKAAVVGVVQNTTGDKEKVVTNTVLNNGRNGESKFVQDLARRIRDDEKATDSQSVGKNSLPNGVRENNNPVLQNNHRKVDEKRSYTMEKKSENGFLPVSSRTDQKGSEIMVKPSEKKDQGKKTELLQEKNHRKEGVTRSDKPLDREGVKKNEPKYTANKKSEEEKTEAINKSGHDQPKHGEGGPRLKDIDVADTRNFRAHDDLSKASSKSVTVLGKRKDLETNGFLYENGSRPNKIQRPAASPLTSVKNGIKLEACQTLPKPVSELQGPPVCKPEVKEDIIKAKEHRVNGFVDSQEPKKRPTSSSSVKVKENGEASSKKRPHPDLKYLDQILNVPQREELHEVDGNEEQEWLFGQSVKLLKKPKTDSTASLDESLQVWNQALRLESADTVALPYVVPF